MKSLWMIMIITIVVILTIFIYAGIFFPIEEAPKLVDEVDTEAITKKADSSDESLEDVVIFTFQRNHPEEMQKYLLQYNGMKDLNALEQNLKEQDYIAILTALWSEQDPDKRLMWLREKQIGSHPILLFELAVEVMKQAPTMENFEEALYLLELGRYRTEIDAVCITDVSASAAGQSLYSIYAKAISEEVIESPALVKALVETPQNDLSEGVLERLLLALKRIRVELTELPSHDWVSDHALQKLFVNTDITLEPKDCLKRREKLLDVYIAEVERHIQKHKSVNPIPIINSL
jgi:hypothetical protein